MKMCGLSLLSAILMVLASRCSASWAADAAPNWNQAEIVFIGELSQARTGPMADSIPPIFMNEVQFKVTKVLRGPLTDQTVSCHHSYRADANFPYEIGKRYIVALSTAQQTIAVRNLELADDAAVKEVELACALPLGWTMVDGKPISPWSALGRTAWSGALPAEVARPEFVCATTGRPALLAGPKVEWSVEAAAPKKPIEWTNPDGDGEYKMTVTNPGDQPLAVPALLAQDGKIMWRESVVILCQAHAYPCPNSKDVKGQVAPFVLSPHQSVSTVINALALQGPEWPQGGDRIEFTFCLGEKPKTMSFYYLSRYHDQLRQAAGQNVEDGGN